MQTQEQSLKTNLEIAKDRLKTSPLHTLPEFQNKKLENQPFQESTCAPSESL